MRTSPLSALTLFTAHVVLFLIVAFAVAAQQQSQQPQPAQPTASVIAEIHATGNTRYTDAQVAAASGLKIGDAATREQLQAAADRLAHLGAFSGVTYRFTSRGAKIAVQFELADAPAFPVLFDNFPWFTDSELTHAIRDAVPLFNGTTPKDGAELDDVTAAIAKLVQSRSVPGTVEHELAPAPDPVSYRSTRNSAEFLGDVSSVLSAEQSGNMLIMEFRLEGAGVTIGSLDFGDSLAQKSDKVREHARDLIGKPFSRLAIEVFENQQVRPVYLSTGQLRVRFGEPVVHGLAPAGQPPPATGAAQAAPQKLFVVLPITPGPVFYFAGVSWSGDTVLHDAMLSNLLGVKSGELASGEKLEAGWQRIEKEYAHRGYLEIKIDPQPQFADAAATVSYRVAITQGPQYRMGELVVTGLSLTAERIVHAVWRQMPGEVFDESYFDEMLAKLARPSSLVFGELPVHYTEMGHWLRRNPDMHTVDVLLDFK